MQEDNMELLRSLELAQQICTTARDIGNNVAKPKPWMLNDGTRMIRIDINDIAYLQADRVYCQIHMKAEGREKEGKVYTVSRPLGEVEKTLPADTFVRIHRSYIINIWMVHMVMGRQVKLMDGTFFTMGEQYSDALDGHFMILNQPYPK